MRSKPSRSLLQNIRSWGLDVPGCDTAQLCSSFFSLTFDFAFLLSFVCDANSWDKAIVNRSWITLHSALGELQDFAKETPGFFDEARERKLKQIESCRASPFMNMSQCAWDYESWMLQQKEPRYLRSAGGGLCITASTGLQRKAAENDHRPAGAFVQGNRRAESRWIGFQNTPR